MCRTAYTERQRHRGTPCSYPQELLIFNNELDPFDPGHNESFWISMEGALDIGALGNALKALCERHTVLQSRFAISVRPWWHAKIWRALLQLLVQCSLPSPRPSLAPLQQHRTHSRHRQAAAPSCCDIVCLEAHTRFSPAARCGHQAAGPHVPCRALWR